MDCRPVAGAHAVRENEETGGNGIYILVVVLLTLPFFLNDFANIYVKSWRWWLFVDYTGVKLFPLMVVFGLICSGKMRAAAFGIQAQSLLRFLATFLIVAAAGTVLDQNGYRLIAKLPGYTALGGMPAITSPVWNWIDLTVGLAMVAICEELVFRGFMRTFICRYTKNAYATVAVSSVVFGLIHWSLGLHAVFVTAVIGAVFMAAYLITRSLPAIMLAHFAVNFIDFAGVIPKSIFKFI